MKFSFMSAAVAASVIWGASAGPLSETHAYSAVTAPVFDADEALDTMHDLSETIDRGKPELRKKRKRLNTYRIACGLRAPVSKYSHFH